MVTDMDTKVGFIGLGKMGSRMARNLLAQGNMLAVYDKLPEASAALKGHGIVESCRSPGQVATCAQLIIVMVHDQQQCDDVLFGFEGVAESCTPGATVVLMSTLSPEYVIALAADPRIDGVRIIDAPVSGGVEGAEKGTLTIMAGGASAAVREALPVLETMGSLVVHVGESPGQGQVAKVLNQMMYFAGIAIASEAVVAAAKAGINPSEFVRVAGNGSGDNWALRNRIPLAWSNDYRSGGALNIASKDLEAALGLCRRIGVYTPVAATVTQAFHAAISMARPDADDAEYVRLVETISAFSLAEGD